MTATRSQAITHGLSPVADSWVAPTLAVRHQEEGAIAQYPFDPARARAMLAEAGRVSGRDGRLTHAATRERFETELNSQAGSDVERKMAAVADNGGRSGWPPPCT